MATRRSSVARSVASAGLTIARRRAAARVGRSAVLSELVAAAARGRRPVPAAARRSSFTQAGTAAGHAMARNSFGTRTARRSSFTSAGHAAGVGMQTRVNTGSGRRSSFTQAGTAAGFEMAAVGTRSGGTRRRTSAAPRRATPATPRRRGGAAPRSSAVARPMRRGQFSLLPSGHLSGRSLSAFNAAHPRHPNGRFRRR